MMYIPTSAPEYGGGIDVSEYIDLFYLWLVRLGGKNQSLLCLLRLKKLITLQSLSTQYSHYVLQSLAKLAEDLNSSCIKFKEISDLLEGLEKHLTTSSSKALLISYLLQRQERFTLLLPCDESPQLFFKECFALIENQSFSRFQAEGMIQEIGSYEMISSKHVVSILKKWFNQY